MIKFIKIHFMVARRFDINYLKEHFFNKIRNFTYFLLNRCKYKFWLKTKYKKFRNSQDQINLKLYMDVDL